jgi:hypothetical protein
MAYYKTINGLRYDRALLEEAQRMTKGQGDGRVSLEDMKGLYTLALEGGELTEIEKRTLLYIRDHFNATRKAGEWLDEQELPLSGLDETVRKVVQKVFGMQKLQVELDAGEVDRQLQLQGDLSFEEAIGNVLKLLSNPADYRGFISPWDFFDSSLVSNTKNEDPVQIGLANMEEAVLYLVPLDAPDQQKKGDFTRELPGDRRSPEDYWIFGLEIPRFPKFRFFAFLRRKGRYGSYAKAFLSRQLPLEERVALVVNGYLGVKGLHWSIDPEEVDRQATFDNAVSFEDVLYWTISLGLTNEESSVSFYDHIIQEVWINPEDPDLSIEFFLQEYLRNGRLYLLPADYEEQVRKGTLDFPYSPYYSGDYDDFWYFGLKFPGKSDVNYQLIMSREDDEPRMEAWSDGFIDGELSLSALIPHVIEEDFQLQGIQWTMPIEELLQQQALDPSWRSFNGVLRQSLNTFLYDDVTKDSLFNVVVHMNPELDRTNFAARESWTRAVREKIREHLIQGHLYLLPMGIYDREDEERSPLLPPADGADILENYVFQLYLPFMKVQNFFAVIPRKVSEENVPYNYGMD